MRVIRVGSLVNSIFLRRLSSQYLIINQDILLWYTVPCKRISTNYGYFWIFASDLTELSSCYHQSQYALTNYSLLNVIVIYELWTSSGPVTRISEFQSDLKFVQFSLCTL
jgi:hypothetical protein